MADNIHERLIASIGVPTTGHLWGMSIDFTPAVLPTAFGDGRALLALTTLNSRPRYYVIRIDSGWSVDDTQADGGDLRDHLDDIYEAIEETFGRAVFEEDGDADPEPWPAFDDRYGTAWWRLAWPFGFDVQGHPYILSNT